MKNTKSIKQVNKFFAFWLRLFRIQSLSVYQLTLSMLVITAVFSVGLTFVGWTYTETLRIKTKIKELKSTTLNKQKEKLKVEVSRLISYLEYIQKDTNRHTLEQLKEEALLYFENLRFGNDGYVFVNTYDGIALLFDGQKLNETKNITDLVDPNGFKIFEKELDLAKLPEGGSFQYLFKKIYTATPQPKLSYVIGFDNWEWIIGTGDYLDNIDDELNILEQDLKRDMYRNIRIAFGIFASVLIVLIGAAYWFATWIQDQFTKFVRILKQASLKKNIEQVLDRIFIRELQTIGFEIVQAEELTKEFGDIIDQSANEIYIFDRDSFKFVHVNKGAVKNCGYSLSELQGMTPLDIKPELNLQQFQDLVEPLIQKNTNRVHFETVHQRKDKSSYPVDIHLTLSFFKEKPVFIAFVYDISERKEAENQLHLSQQRYSDLFENAPISLWEEDFSEVIEYLDQQMKHYKLDLESLFEQHPEVLFHCSGLVKVTDVNNQTLSLFEAKNKEELFGNLNKLFTENSILAFEQSLLALYKGEKQFGSEAENLTLKGKKLDVFLRWSFLAKDDKPSQKVIVSIVDLTELKKAEEELFIANKIINRSSVVALLWRNEEGWPVEFVSKNIEKLTGYTVSKFMTGKVSYADIIHKDDLDRVAKEVDDNSRIKDKQSFVHEPYRIITKTGEVKWLSDITFIRRNSEGVITHYEGVVQDVTDKRKAEEALSNSNKLMQYIIEHNQSDVAVHDRELKYLYVSQSYLEHYRVKNQNVIGKHHYDVFPDLPQKWRDVHQKALAGEISSADNDSYVREDGSVEWTRWECRPWYEADGSIGGIIVYTEVITEQKQIEEELKTHRNRLEEIVKDRTGALEKSQDALLNLVDDLNRKSGELEISNIRLAEINEELETFTYSVSHDLKAPLRGIDGYSQLLFDSYGKNIDKDAREFLLNIRKSTQQMNLLIEDLLAYSRMERKVFETENIQFKPIIDNLLLAFSKTITENNVQIKRSFPDDFMLVGDKDGLNLVLRNLLDNALKFSFNNKTIQIEIGARESDTHWHIFVKDNGIGFDMKYHDRIFKIFQRLHLPEEFEGTGIGLAMVYKAVQRMNGTIWGKSETGKGAKFYIEIEKRKESS